MTTEEGKDKLRQEFRFYSENRDRYKYTHTQNTVDWMLAKTEELRKENERLFQSTINLNRMIASGSYSQADLSAAVLAERDACAEVVYRSAWPDDNECTESEKLLIAARKRILSRHKPEPPKWCLLTCPYPYFWDNHSWRDGSGGSISDAILFCPYCGAKRPTTEGK